MKRRTFIAGLGSAAAWPLAAGAQQPLMPMVGYINTAPRESHEELLVAFREGLKVTGFVEGKNITIEYRFADNQPDRVAALVADLVGRNVAVIAATGNTVTAAKAATSKIPIIFQVGSDPVRDGLIASLSHPGGNLTGVNSLVAEIWPKQFDLIAKLLPNSRVIAILSSAGTPTQALERLKLEALPAANAIGRKLVVVTASTPDDIDAVFVELRRRGTDALIVPASTLSYSRREQLAALAARYGIPAIYAFRINVEAGGLMSYGVTFEESWRLVGSYTGRVLKGEKPADLPVVQPTRFEFVINMKTAKALGLDIPPGVLAIADEVIE